MTSMWRRRGKDASPFGKASCSEPRTHILPGVWATSMRLSPNGSSRDWRWPNWQFLAKRSTLTATPQHLLRSYYRQGYPAGLVDKKAMPYVLPWHNAISEAEWQRRVRWFCHSRYLHDMDALYAERAELKFDTFYRTMDLTNPIKAMQYDQTNSEQAKQAEQAEQATQDEQAEQTTVPTQQTITGPSALAGPHSADRFTTARTCSQCMDRQATVAATGSNQ